MIGVTSTMEFLFLLVSVIVVGAVLWYRLYRLEIILGTWVNELSDKIDQIDNGDVF